MLEAAIALPVFILLVFMIFVLSDMTTKYCALFTALGRAAHAFQSISSVQGVTESQALQYAGNTFYQQVLNLGLSPADVSFDPTASPSYVLVGETSQLTSVCGDTVPTIYQLRARVRTRSILEGLLPSFGAFKLSTITILETRASLSTPPPSGEKFVYVPSAPVATRVQPRSASSIPD